MREEQASTCLILLSSRESKKDIVQGLESGAKDVRSWVIVELVTRDILRSRREGSCTAVMMCDIDHFKRINERFGHVGSDTVLREVRVGCRTPCVPTTLWGAMEARNSWWHSTVAIPAAPSRAPSFFAGQLETNHFWWGRSALR